jgi:hypothetical protein
MLYVKVAGNSREMETSLSCRRCGAPLKVMRL